MGQVQVSGDALVAVRRGVPARSSRASRSVVDGIVIEEGAMLEGRIVIGAEEGAAAQKQPDTRTPAPARDAAPRSDKTPAPTVTTP
jgi:hypothetical protein